MPNAAMPVVETEIMRDAFCFLRDHNNPPANEATSGAELMEWETGAADQEDPGAWTKKGA